VPIPFDSIERDFTERDFTERDTTKGDTTARDSTARDSTARDSTARDPTARDPAVSFEAAPTGPADVATAFWFECVDEFVEGVTAIGTYLEEVYLKEASLKKSATSGLNWEL